MTLGDRPVDVCIDGRRVWTFWTQRDTATVGRRRAGCLAGPARPVAAAAAPAPGRSRAGSRCGTPPPVTCLLRPGRRARRRRGTDPGAEPRGVDLGIDKSGRLVPAFAGRSDHDIGALLDAIDAVMEALRSAGVEPFVAYGTLLGAVREGRVLGTTPTPTSATSAGTRTRSTWPASPSRSSAGSARRAGRSPATAAPRSRSTSPRPTSPAVSTCSAGSSTVGACTSWVRSGSSSSATGSTRWAPPS